MTKLHLLIRFLTPNHNLYFFTSSRRQWNKHCHKMKGVHFQKKFHPLIKSSYKLTVNYFNRICPKCSVQTIPTCDNSHEVCIKLWHFCFCILPRHFPLQSLCIISKVSFLSLLNTLLHVQQFWNTVPLLNKL